MPTSWIKASLKIICKWKHICYFADRQVICVRTYAHILNKTSFEDSMRGCEALGYLIAKIITSADLTAAKKFITNANKQKSNVWIGLQKSASFVTEGQPTDCDKHLVAHYSHLKWVVGDSRVTHLPVAFNDWKFGECKELCIAMEGDLLQDKRCDDNHYGLCESES